MSEVCRRFGVEPDPPPPGTKLGIALETSGWPINGLRHPPEKDTNGWYLWRGSELSDEMRFFSPLHVEHVGARLPEAARYLGLPPGWRFLIAPGHEDVWFDEALLSV